MRVLLAEDDAKLASFIKQGLRSENFVVDHVTAGKLTLLKAMSINYGLIILDIDLPDVRGTDICAKLRANKNHTPIIMLTAESDADVKIHAFDNGADDYITKPFSFAELMARMKALIRRSQQTADYDTTIKIGDLEIDTAKRFVSRAGNPIKLRNKEFLLLKCLAENRGRVMSRTALLEQVWENHLNLLKTTVDVHIRWLRERIDDDYDLKLIHTVHGVGYKLDLPEAEGEM